MEIVDEYEFLTIDVETANQHRRSICQLAVVGYLGGKCEVLIDRFVDPREEFGYYQTKKHGIAEGNVEDCPTFPDLYENIVRAVEGKRVFCHSNFDQQAIDAACLYHDLPLIDIRWIDSCRLAKQLLPGSSSKLNALCDRYQIEFEHHDAMEDAIATAKVLAKLMAEFNLTVSKCDSIAGFSQSYYPQDVGEIDSKYSYPNASRNPALVVNVCEIIEYVGKEIVLTGSFLRGQKADFSKLARAVGFHVKESLTRSSQYLVYGMGGEEDERQAITGKRKKAIDYNHRHNQGILIWSEDEFISLVQRSPVNHSIG